MLRNGSLLLFAIVLHILVIKSGIASSTGKEMYAKKLSFGALLFATGTIIGCLYMC